MITRLDTSKLVAERRARISSPMPATRSSTPVTRPIAPSEGVPSLANIVLLLQGVESRLTRIEDRLNRRSVPAPAGAPPSDAIICGLIKGQMLSDILQLVTSNAMTGVFVIDTQLCKCNLYFHEGRICHAENGSMVGEDAFFAAFGAESGRYHFTETIDLPEQRTIGVGTQYLVLEALRRMDESHG